MFRGDRQTFLPRLLFLFQRRLHLKFKMKKRRLLGAAYVGKLKTDYPLFLIFYFFIPFYFFGLPAFEDQEEACKRKDG